MTIQGGLTAFGTRAAKIHPGAFDTPRFVTRSTPILAFCDKYKVRGILEGSGFDKSLRLTYAVNSACSHSIPAAVHMGVHATKIVTRKKIMCFFDALRILLFRVNTKCLPSCAFCWKLICCEKTSRLLGFYFQHCL